MSGLPGFFDELTERLRPFLADAVARRVFPGAALAVGRGGEPVVLAVGRFTHEPDSPAVTDSTLYDLASLTKILSTTALAMLFVDEESISLDDRLSRFWPDAVPSDKEGLTVTHLLAHVSGLPDWRPLYRDIERLPHAERRDAALRLILNTPLEARPGTRTIYSDLNFILLGLILENIGGARQDELFLRLIARPLGLADVGYRPLDRDCPAPTDIAPTETAARWSGPPQGPYGEPRPPVPVGVVHDDNAAGLSGVAGHAGLFGTASGAWQIFNALRRARLGLPSPLAISRETVARFWSPAGYDPIADRALGFDRVYGQSSAGRLFSTDSVGHTGYTGTSLWYDPRRDLTVILLSNRVQPTADNRTVIEFRPELHDLIANLIESRV